MNNTSDKDETKTLANLLQPLVFSYKMRKNLKNLLGKMISHVESCSLESLLRFKKMEKIKRILMLFKKFSNIPLQMHLFLIRYLENCWENLVMENGFINIHISNRALSIFFAKSNHPHCIFPLTSITYHLITLNKWILY